MSDQTLQDLVNNLESKEAVLILISQVIKDCPNDARLGEKLRKNLQNYLVED